MRRLFIAMLAGLSLTDLAPVCAAEPLTSQAHMAHVRLMLRSDGIEVQIDASLPRLRAGMMQAVARSRGEASLTADEIRRFDSISKPVLDHLKQHFIDEAIQGYAALSDADIDDLIRANGTPLGQRFMTFMVHALDADEPIFNTYATETADAIGRAYAQNSVYVSKSSKDAAGYATPAGRLYVTTGNAAMTGEAVDGYFSVVVGGHLTGIDFDTLSDSDSERLRPIFVEGLHDLERRINAFRVAELANAFSADELDQLNASYSLPAVKVKVDLALAMLPDGRKRNQSVIRAAYDEVVAAFGATSDGA